MPTPKCPICISLLQDLRDGTRRITAGPDQDRWAIGNAASPLWQTPSSIERVRELQHGIDEFICYFNPRLIDGPCHGQTIVAENAGTDGLIGAEP
jgi:hypothetical protein